MPTFVTLTVIGPDDPFKDTKNQMKAYTHASHHGCCMATGQGKPLMVEHTLENPSAEQLRESEAKMYQYIEEVIKAAVVASAVVSPFNGRASVPGIGRF